MKRASMYKKSVRLNAYEALWSVVSGGARLWAGVSPSFGQKLRERDESLSAIATWPKVRSRFPKCVLFICSSAGE